MFLVSTGSVRKKDQECLQSRHRRQSKRGTPCSIALVKAYKADGCIAVHKIVCDAIQRGSQVAGDWLASGDHKYGGQERVIDSELGESGRHPRRAVDYHSM